MTSVKQRLKALEKQCKPKSEVFLCWCKRERDLAQDGHEPDCPARDARDSDITLICGPTAREI